MIFFKLYRCVLGKLIFVDFNKNFCTSKLYRCILGKLIFCDFRKNFCTSRCWFFRFNNLI